jgi:hypothetical protein
MGFSSTIQASVKTRLNSLSPFTSDVDVISEDLGDITNQIDKALAKTGIFVLIMMPTMRRVGERTMMDVSFDIDIAEEPILNRTGSYHTAHDVAENVFMALNNFGITNPSGLTRIRMSDIVLEEDKPLLRYRTTGTIRTKLLENED